MKRIVLLLTLFFAFGFASIGKISAYEPLPYWYSDSTKISSFSQSSVDYSIVRYDGCNMTISNLDSYIDYAVGEWDDMFSPDFSLVSYGTGEDVQTGCISRNNADDLNIPENVVGFGGTGTMTFSQRFRNPELTGYINFYTHSSGAMYLIWDDDGTDGSVQTSNFTITQWRNVATHEIGHVMVFLGHNTQGSAQLMHMYTNSITTIQFYDKKHMLLVYGLE